jgi:hypothetical protein
VQALSPDALPVRRKENSNAPKGGDIVQYALLIYSKLDELDAFSDEERRALSGEYWELRKDPRVVGGAGLHPDETATTVRVQDGRTLVTDGPFADTKEVFGGWYLFEGDDLDGAIQIAARIPAARLGGSVEIRPVMEQQR